MIHNKSNTLVLFLRYNIHITTMIIINMMNDSDTCFFNKIKPQDLAGNYTFQEAFDRTGRIINITVAPQNDYDPPRLLNYLTAPHVCV